MIFYRGASTPKGGANPSFGQLFPKTARKRRIFGPQEGMRPSRSLDPPLDFATSESLKNKCKPKQKWLRQNNQISEKISIFQKALIYCRSHLAMGSGTGFGSGVHFCSGGFCIFEKCLESFPRSRRSSVVQNTWTVLLDIDTIWIYWWTVWGWLKLSMLLKSSKDCRHFSIFVALIQ